MCVFEVMLRDEHRRLWLAKSGRQLLGDIMKSVRCMHAYEYINTFVCENAFGPPVVAGAIMAMREREREASTEYLTDF